VSSSSDLTDHGSIDGSGRFASSRYARQFAETLYQLFQTRQGIGRRIELVEVGFDAAGIILERLD